jgi:hypothetical protein
MELLLNLEFELDDQRFTIETLVGDFESHQDKLADIVREEGRILVANPAIKDSGDYSEPLIRLAGQWLRKLKWIIAGDSETIPFRNTEQCFAFMPAAGGVEVSLFGGTELEVEEYIFEPITVPLKTLVKASVDMGDALVGLIEKVDASLLESDEDCKDLKTDLEESKKAWHSYELRRR